MQNLVKERKIVRTIEQSAVVYLYIVYLVFQSWQVVICLVSLTKFCNRNVLKGTGAYTPPLDFFSFDYFFIGTDVRIQDHETRTRTFLVLGKKSIL
jgi:hypothetical protein